MDYIIKCYITKSLDSPLVLKLLSAISNRKGCCGVLSSSRLSNIVRL